MAKVVECMVNVCFESHIYRWNDTVKRQKKGGAIGLRATGSLAKVTMDHWIEVFRRKLTDLDMRVWLLKKYMDDVLVVTTNLALGSRYRNGRIERTERDTQEDRTNNRTKEEVTMEVLRNVANTVLPFLEFTSEVSVGEERP